MLKRFQLHGLHAYTPEPGSEQPDPPDPGVRDPDLDYDDSTGNEDEDNEGNEDNED